MIRVLSPHVDDAALSLGQYLAVEPGVVHTVFAGVPQQFGYVTPYDEACGFQSSHTAMLRRRNEDKEACAVLGAISRPCGFLDAQYRDSDTFDVGPIVDMIRGLVTDRVHMFVPLGLDHVDHEIVSRSARLACPPEIMFYEDLPARVLHPELVPERLEEIRAEGWAIDPLPVPLPSGPRDVKEKALRCYRSQLKEIDPAMLVPERCWRAVR